ncbi:stemmadenine O-acetyltransferase-like [Humulus lupulus]|uniref:stemmadenine O-acetyltransferase-like n=1 Tax=Humulus lupulus TaxID=3486 RepID=UPI002B41423A|nr:stemmadenine O-acetyltransferase-like [Humulus lupulus]
MKVEVEVEVISKEIITPSSPTPSHLRHYRLSYLDQISPQTYNPLVLFYELDDDYQDHHNGSINIDQISNKIKNSLSEVLTLYYPLAGRVKNNRFVDCNDEGIPYSVARVKSPSHLSDAINNPAPKELNKFLPFIELSPLNEFSLGFQLNIFDRGGVAVSLCLSHQLGDALSCIMFVKTWAAIARGEGDRVARPEFVSAELFPPVDVLKFNPNGSINKNVISKRFVFEAKTIEAIRLNYEKKTRLEGERGPSRVEALSAFIWTRFVAANTSNDVDKLYLAKSEIVYSVCHPVNLRPKLDPPLPDHSFGNLYRWGFSLYPMSSSSVIGTSFSSDEYGCEAVRKIREGIRQVDNDFLRKVQQGEEEQFDFIMEYAKELYLIGGELRLFSFSSLCRFPLYDADFGWGKPLWVSSASLTFSNLVALMDSKNGNGIEAYIGLKEDQMAKLEADQDFLKACSIPNNVS